MAASASGRGYWLVDSAGAVFTFGDAEFFGSPTAAFAADPVVAMAPTATGRGYRQVTAAGVVIPFGDAAGAGPSVAPASRGAVVGAAARPAASRSTPRASPGQRCSKAPPGPT